MVRATPGDRAEGTGPGRCQPALVTIADAAASFLSKRTERNNHGLVGMISPVRLRGCRSARPAPRLPSVLADGALRVRELTAEGDALALNEPTCRACPCGDSARRGSCGGGCLVPAGPAG
jgi:hypothetical protein